MPSILFDARPLLEQGGVSRVAARVLDMIRRDHADAEVTCITTGWKRSQGPGTKDRGPTIHLPLPNKLWSLLCWLRLTSLDRVASFISGRVFDELILPNVGFVGKPNIPYSIIVHDLSFLIEPRWFPWKMRLWHRAVGAKSLIRNAHRVWCVSKTTMHDVTRLLSVPPDRIRVLPPETVTSSPCTLPPTPCPLSLPRFYVLAFGGDNARKNVSVAIAAVERLREEEPFRDLTLVVIGSRWKHLPSRGTICFPTVSDDERDMLYRNAAALLYPSWYEGFGLPLHEAARYNIPLLASAHGALPETAPAKTILIPPAKPQLWVGALREALGKNDQ